MKSHVYEMCLPKDISVGYIEDESVSGWVGNRYTGSSQERFFVYWEGGKVAGYVVKGGYTDAEVFAEMNGQSVFVGQVDDPFPFGSPDNSNLWMYRGKRGLENVVGSVDRNGGIYQTESINPAVMFGEGKGFWSGKKVGYINPLIDIRLMAGATYLLLFNTDDTGERWHYEEVDVDWSESPLQISGYPQSDTWDFRRALDRLMDDNELHRYFAQGWFIDWVKPLVTNEQYSVWKRYARSALVKGYTVHLKKRKTPS